MANQQHVKMLLRDVEEWNRWREEEPTERPNLERANLRGANLRGANLCGASLIETHLNDADLSNAKLHRANLHRAVLSRATLIATDLYKAKLSEAKLFAVSLFAAKLIEADLTNADLRYASLVRTRLDGAILSGCNVYGISAWDIRLVGTVQSNLLISPPNRPRITVDNLEVAQFLYVMLNNQKVRAVLDTITSKVVLILGRFSAQRKLALDALREELRRHPHEYIPVLFDFEPQPDKPILETVKALANLARFVLVDLTDPNMVRSEVSYITANLPFVPVQSVIERDAKLPTEYGTWEGYKSFLPVYRFADLTQLLANLSESVISPVERHVRPRRFTDTESK